MGGAARAVSGAIGPTPPIPLPTFPYLGWRPRTAEAMLLLSHRSTHRPCYRHTAPGLRTTPSNHASPLQTLLRLLTLLLRLLPLRLLRLLPLRLLRLLPLRLLRLLPQLLLRLLPQLLLRLQPLLLLRLLPLLLRLLPLLLRLLPLLLRLLPLLPPTTTTTTDHASPLQRTHRPLHSTSAASSRAMRRSSPNSAASHAAPRPWHGQQRSARSRTPPPHRRSCRHLAEAAARNGRAGHEPPPGDRERLRRAGK